MTRFTRSLLHWTPAILVTVALVAAFLLFRSTISDWLTPLLPAEWRAEDRADVRLADRTDTDSPGVQNSTAYWTCSMHPSVKSETQGTCPICAMDLTPVTIEEIETGTIIVDAQRRQLIGVKTGTVVRRPLTQTVRGVGYLTPDETRVSEVTLKLDAWIGEVYADYTGKKVQKGETLFTFYSPQLWAAQQEYLQAIGDADQRSERLEEAAATRLRLWGVSQSVIDQIRKQQSPIEYIPYVSPVTGTVLQKNVVPGSAATAGDTIYRIADLSTIWLEVEVYERDLPAISVGQSADITLPHLPDQQISGTISYIYPVVESTSRTARLRIEVPNPDDSLKLNMYANAEVRVPLGNRLVVPESAVIYAGKSRVVFIDLGEGRLEPRTIEVGARTADYVEVLSGLSEGDIVVTSGNFLIAAESKLKAGLDKW